MSNYEQMPQSEIQGFGDVPDAWLKTFVTTGLYENSVIISGLNVQADSSPDAYVQVSIGTAYQNGAQIVVSAPQYVNVLATNAQYWGTGQAADPTNPRIDIVCIEYATQDADPQTLTFVDPANGTTSNSTVNTRRNDYYGITIVHGTPAASPVVPSTPAGYVLLAQIAVPANVTTVTSSNITDERAAVQISGNALNKISGGRIWVDDTKTTSGSWAIKSASGIKHYFGSTAYLHDNTSANVLEISGGSSGISLLSQLNAQGQTIAAGSGATLSGVLNAEGATIQGSSTTKLSLNYVQLDSNSIVPSSALQGTFVTSITAGTGISTTNPTGAGAATINVSSAPNSALVGPLVSSITGQNGIGVTNPTGVGAATLTLSNLANGVLAGPLVSSLTVNSTLTATNPTAVGAATLGLNLGNTNTWTATQTFNAGATFNDPVNINTQNIIIAEQSNAYILPHSGGSIGFTNSAANAWALKIVDGTSPAVYTLLNTLDNGTGGMKAASYSFNNASGMFLGAGPTETPSFYTTNATRMTLELADYAGAAGASAAGPTLRFTERGTTAFDFYYYAATSGTLVPSDALEIWPEWANQTVYAFQANGTLNIIGVAGHNPVMTVTTANGTDDAYLALIAQGNQTYNLHTVRGSNSAAFDGAYTFWIANAGNGNVTFPQNILVGYGGVGEVAVGYYVDANNVALRPPNGGIYFQNNGGGATWATMDGAGLHLDVPLDSPDLVIWSVL